MKRLSDRAPAALDLTGTKNVMPSTHLPHGNLHHPQTMLEQLYFQTPEMEAAPPATPRHSMFPLWLLPSGPDQVNG